MADSVIIGSASARARFSVRDEVRSGATGRADAVDRRVERARWLRVLKWSVIVGAIAVEIGILAVWLSRADLTLGEFNWGWIAVAVGAEAVSVAAVGAVYRPLLRSGGLPITRARSVALGAASSAMTATAPGGTAVASTFLYRQLRRAGGTRALAGWSVAVADALSIVGFGVIAGTAAAVQSADSMAAAARTAGIGLGIALAVIGAAVVTLHHTKPLVRLLRAVCRRLPGGRDERCATVNIDAAVNQFTAIRPRWQDLARALVLASLTWAADLMCFLLSLHAVGISGVGIGSAAAAYGAGLATTSLTLLPGGVGTVEAGMLLGLTHAGVAGSRAIAGIATYRVVAYILVAGVGWAVWATLRRRPLLAFPTEEPAEQRTHRDP
jgi:uncharacterized membrane protein YbhN (UPF0104 family)